MLVDFLNERAQVISQLKALGEERKHFRSIMDDKRLSLCSRFLESYGPQAMETVTLEVSYARLRKSLMTL